jgi:hypothetical protein
MPTYYFDIWAEDRLVADETGIAIDDIDMVLREAQETLREIRALADGESLLGDARVTIRDESGEIVATLDLRDDPDDSRATRNFLTTIRAWLLAGRSIA